MVREYVHQNLGKEVYSISGYYVPLHETKWNYKGREILYITGTFMIDNSCCVRGGSTYAIVPGYLLNWEIRKNADGMPVSEVEPIEDSRTKQEIATFLRDKKCAGSIEFW